MPAEAHSALARHRGKLAFTAAMTLLGAALGPVLGPTSWPLWRALLAGAVAGLGIAFTIVATRTIGAFEADE